MGHKKYFKNESYKNLFFSSSILFLSTVAKGYLSNASSVQSFREAMVETMNLALDAESQWGLLKSNTYPYVVCFDSVFRKRAFRFKFYCLNVYRYTENITKSAYNKNWHAFHIQMVLQFVGAAQVKVRFCTLNLLECWAKTFVSNSLLVKTNLQRRLIFRIYLHKYCKYKN